MAFNIWNGTVHFFKCLTELNIGWRLVDTDGANGKFLWDRHRCCASSLLEGGRLEAGGIPQIQIQTQTSPGLLERDANHHTKIRYWYWIPGGYKLKRVRRMCVSIWMCVWELWLKCRAIMVERAQGTGVDPLMKFSGQKNTHPPRGAQSPPWALPGNQPTMELKTTF